VDKLRALETFIAVAEVGSFSAASRQLNVSAPSVTRIIGDLEADLGVKLLNRTTRANRHFADNGVDNVWKVVHYANYN